MIEPALTRLVLNLFGVLNVFATSPLFLLRKHNFNFTYFLAGYWTDNKRAKPGKGKMGIPIFAWLIFCYLSNRNVSNSYRVRTIFEMVCFITLDVNIKR